MPSPERLSGAPKKRNTLKELRDQSTSALVSLTEARFSKEKVTPSMYRKARKTIERDIFPTLETARPNLKQNPKAIWESDLLQKVIIPTLLSGLQFHKPYTVTSTKTSITLTSVTEAIDENIVEKFPKIKLAKPLKRRAFNLSDYDENLNFPKEATKNAPKVELITETVQEKKDRLKGEKFAAENQKQFLREKKIYEVQNKIFSGLNEDATSDTEKLKKKDISLEEYTVSTFSKLDQIAQKNYEVKQVNAGLQDEFAELIRLKKESKLDSMDNTRIQSLMSQLDKYASTAEEKGDIETLAAIHLYHKIVKNFFNSLGLQS